MVLLIWLWKESVLSRITPRPLDLRERGERGVVDGEVKTGLLGKHRFFANEG